MTRPRSLRFCELNNDRFAESRGNSLQSSDRRIGRRVILQTRQGAATDARSIFKFLQRHSLGLTFLFEQLKCLS